MRDDHEEWGQVDGDDAPMANFTPTGGGQPWLRAGMTPWHMWGNSQVLETIVQDSSAATRTNTPGQLVKISYKRPETWNWLFAAKLVSGPDSPVNETQIEVAFDLMIGIGRSAILLQSAGVNQDKAFEQFFFQWGPVGPFPRGAQLYSTQVLAPNRTLRTDAPFPDQTGNAVAGNQSASPIDQIVAEDINLACRLIALAPPGSASIGKKVSVEVSAQFAPKTHIRPDWYLNAPPEQVFPGGETEGR